MAALTDSEKKAGATVSGGNANEEKQGMDRNEKSNTLAISGEEIVDIAVELGAENIKDTNEKSKRKETIEESLKNKVKSFIILAKKQEKCDLTELGVSCGLEKPLATALAYELMGKYPQQQSNGMYCFVSSVFFILRLLNSVCYFFFSFRFVF